MNEPWMPVCNVCGVTCELGHSYVAIIQPNPLGIEIHFSWGCEHHPVRRGILYFGSHTCMCEWLEDHPTYKDQYNAFIETTKRCH